MKAIAKKEEAPGAGLSLQETVDRWLGDMIEGRLTSMTTGIRFDWQPKVDINETDREYIISASVPGVDKKDMSVEINGNQLVIRGERKVEKEESAKGYLRREQAYGTFYRSFELPENVKAAQIKATNRNGLLEIHLPKAREELPENSRKIPVE